MALLKLQTLLSRIWQALRNPGIVVGLLATVLLVTLAYQARPSYNVTVGGPLDAPLLEGFNTREVTLGDNPTPFRWSTARSQIKFAHIGAQDLVVTLSLNGARPPGEEAPSLRISAGGESLLNIAPSPAPQEYTFPVSRALIPDGTLILTLETNAFIPPGDPNPRPLGIALTGIRVTPGVAPDLFIAPTVEMLFSVLGAAALTGLLFALIGLGPILVALGAALPGALAAWLLVADRLWLTSGSWPLGWMPAACVAAPVAGIAAAGLGLLQRGMGLRVPVIYIRLLLALIFLACLVRLAGQLHPQIFIVDLNFHRNRFDTVQGGTLLFTIPSAEWGGRQTFYLPTAYLAMLPVQWLINDTLLTIRIFTVALGTLGALPLFALIARVSRSGRAALLASILYLWLPISILPFSWGITTNIFGEFFALCALALAVTTYPRFSPLRPASWFFVLAVLVALLSHPGVVQLVAVATALLALFWALAKPRATGAAAWVAFSLLLAGGLAYLVYYRHFLGDMLNTLAEIRQERATEEAAPGIGLRVGGSVADRSLGLVSRYADTWLDWLLGGLRGFWQEAQAYYRVWPIAGAILGYATLRNREARAQGLMRVYLAWGATVILFAVVGWLLNLYVRYALFLLPIAAIGAGLLMSRIWSRGRAGVALTAILLVFFIAEALALWHYRISYAFK